MRLTSGPARRAVGRAIGELKVAVCDRGARARMAAGRARHGLNLGFGQDHLYAYDVETLAARLTSAGFVDVAQRPYDPARDSRPYTLYLDARKPGRPRGARQTE